MPAHEEHEDGYAGPATLVVDGAEVAVNVVLRGRFEPIDGRYHWYGRVEVGDEDRATLADRSGPVLLRSPHGEAAGELSDVDTWQRYRITGTSRPPFPVPTSLSDIEGTATG